MFSLPLRFRLRAYGKTEAAEYMEINKIPAAILALGDSVRVVSFCPIDFEGVGPLPGDMGEVVELPDHRDGRNHTSVWFQRIPAKWKIPGDYLERIR